MELEVLGDRYEMQEPIGRGGMATIYRAVDLRMGRVVAAKILREVYSTDPKFVTRFQREARAASALQHPNIVQVYDYGQSGDNYYIVMEFVEGADLRRYLKKNGILPNDRVIQIAHDVALGLGAAHKMGIVHRDVKPQNIMLNDQGLVKLTDFGIASMYKDAEAERLTTTGMTLGTVQYYAPEQAQGEIVSPAADVYALGIVMYEMLTGRTPFDGDTPVTVAMRHIQDIPEPPSAYNPRVSPGLERIILRCLEKDPKDRYRDGNALAYALENLGRPGRPGSGVGLPSRAGANVPGQSQVASRGSGVGYGGTAVSSNPLGPGGRSSRMSNPRLPGLSDDFGDAPTYDARYETGEGGIGTHPFPPAGATLPRGAVLSRPPGLGGPKRPDETKKRNVPLIAGVISGAVVLLVICVVLAITLGNALGIGQSAATATATTVATTQPSPTTSNATATSATSPTAVPVMVRVPNVVGDTLSKAVSVLSNVTPTTGANQQGLAANPVARAQPGQPPDIVLSTNPSAGTQVPAGSTVTIYYEPPATATATSIVTATPTGTATATPTGTATGTATP